MTVEAVVGWVNRSHGLGLTPVRRLAGGFQGGAYLVRRSDGTPAVLKWSRDRAWAKQVLRAEPLLRKVRRRGYPTPAWLAVGTTDGGFPYQVQEFVEGAPMPRIDLRNARLLIGVVEQQAGLDPDPGRNWSEYARGVVFGDARERLELSGDAGATVVGAFDRLCRPLAGIELPATDMVHGDLSKDNVHVLGGRVTGVVDIEAIGSGSRVFDLAAVLRGGCLEDADAAAIELVRRTAERIAGPDVLRVFVAATVYELLLFGIDRWDGGIDHAVGPMVALARRL